MIALNSACRPAAISVLVGSLASPGSIDFLGFAARAVFAREGFCSCIGDGDGDVQPSSTALVVLEALLEAYFSAFARPPADALFT